MAVTIPEVDSSNIKHCMLIDLTIDSTTYYISNAYKKITHNSNTYTELGSLLAVDQLREDIKTTNGDINIVLSGIPSNQDYIQLVLANNVKGGNVVISRAFLNDDYSTSNVYQRYKGVITNFNISEDENIIEGELTNSVSVSCASIVTVLENRIAGQRTNPTDRNKFFPGDDTFDRVPDLNNVQFDFGREYTGGTGIGGGGGGGGGCFVADTQITMADGTFKPIQMVEVGDSVMCLTDPISDDPVYEPGIVEEISQPKTDVIAVYTVGNTVIKCTPDHPVYVQNKGWCSLDPEATKQNHNLDVSIISVSDAVVFDQYHYGDPKATDSNTIEHIEIQQRPDTQTYNLSSVKDHHTYFANGVLVHNKRNGGGNNRAVMRR